MRGVEARSVRALALLAAALAGCADATARRPDVVLLAADTLRADRLSCYGYERPTTPFLDRLAREGARFEDVTSQFSWTIPSMISAFTGQYLGGRVVTVPAEERTLAELFREAGYATVGVVANVTIQEDTGLARGFDTFVAPTVAEFSEDDWSLDELVELALPAVREVLARDPRPPLLLWLHPVEPHDPYEPREAGPLAGRSPGFGADSWQARYLEGLGFGERVPELLAEAREERDRYDREVRSLDLGVERLFVTLAELGLDRDLLFAFFSDHGEGLWDHEAPSDHVELAVSGEGDALRALYMKHGAIQYQEVIGTPLILWGRGIPVGATVARPVENVDLLPTLLELCAVPATPGLDGRSLVPLLSGAREEPRPYLYSYGVGTLSVREVATGLKLIVRSGIPSRGVELSTELYDLRADPAERRDLASERREDRRRLYVVLRQWLDANPVDPSGDEPDDLDARLEAIGYTESDAGD